MLWRPRIYPPGAAVPAADVNANFAGAPAPLFFGAIDALNQIQQTEVPDDAAVSPDKCSLPRGSGVIIGAPPIRMNAGVTGAVIAVAVVPFGGRVERIAGRTLVTSGTLSLWRIRPTAPSGETVSAAVTAALTPVESWTLVTLTFRAGDTLLLTYNDAAGAGDQYVWARCVGAVRFV